MLIEWRPGKTVIDRQICAFHGRQPDKSYAGCTCSGAYTWEEKSVDEWTEEERAQYFNQFPS